MVDLIRYIQTPSINIELFNPVSRNLQEIGLHLWISRIELRHIARKGKSMVRQVATIPQIISLYRELIDVDPVLINRILPVFDHILPLGGIVANMVEDGIQHNLHSTRMSLFH